MPQKKTPEQQELTSRVSTSRAHMAMYRTVLLQFLDKVKRDVVEMDHSCNRYIVRTRTVSCKRITRTIITGVLHATVDAFAELSVAPGALDILGIMKAKLREEIETVAWKGNIVPCSHYEATRVTRDDVKVRRGGFALVDPDTREIAEAAWSESGQRAQLATEAKQLKASVDVSAVAEEDATGSTPVAVEVDTERTESPVATPAAATSVVAATDPPSPQSPLPRAIAATIMPRKPRSSISKGEAAKLFQIISDYVAAHFLDQNLMKAVSQLVDDFW
jgi:hypothetical protein